MTDTSTDNETDANAADATTEASTDTDAGDNAADADASTDAARATRTAVVAAGPDDDSLGAALADQGVAVERVEGVANRDALADAGIVDAALFLLTDARQATAIPVAKDLNPDLRAVVYARESVPEFVRGQVDLVVDPALLEPATVAEELAA
jgi:hypothetical protein